MKKIFIAGVMLIGLSACGQTSTYVVTPIPDKDCVVINHTETNGWTDSERDPGESNISGEYCKTSEPK